jgi:membrane-associated HD superfamily phosphohydrolase
MAFEKYTTEKLKKYKKTLLIIAIIMLFIMCFALGVGLYQSSNQKDSNLIYLVPTVFGPLTMIPIMFTASIDSELKKRSKNNP